MHWYSSLNSWWAARLRRYTCTCGWFIQEHDSRVAQETDGYTEPSLHPSTVCLDVVIGHLEGKEVERGRREGGGGRTRERAWRGRREEEMEGEGKEREKGKGDGGRGGIRKRGRVERERRSKK